MNDVPSMNGKTCVVTGATAGIGLVAARELARAGATVIAIARNEKRGEEVVDAIRRETGNPAVSFLRADLSSLADVRRVAREILARHPRLQVLINNAGAMFALRQETAEGFEMTFAVNHLGPFLLTNLLLDALKAAGAARIVNVSSEAHEDVDGLDFGDLQATRRGFGGYPRSEAASVFYSLALPWAHPGFLQYARTKLANLLFTSELSRRLEGTGVTVNAVHPGVVASRFGAGNGVYGWFMQRFLRFRGISAEEGARTILYLATSPEVANISGRYFVDGKLAAGSAAAQDRAAAAKLWELTEAATVESAR